MRPDSPLGLAASEIYINNYTQLKFITYFFFKYMAVIKKVHRDLHMLTNGGVSIEINIFLIFLINNNSLIKVSF